MSFENNISRIIPSVNLLIALGNNKKKTCGIYCISHDENLECFMWYINFSPIVCSISGNSSQLLIVTKTFPNENLNILTKS